MTNIQETDHNEIAIGRMVLPCYLMNLTEKTGCWTEKPVIKLVSMYKAIFKRYVHYN